MLELIPLAKDYALPALSGFSVGAVGQGASGALYFGANFEFTDCPVSQTVHAEQATVVNAACHGESGLQRLAVSAAPCGYCRQFLYELVTANELTILLNEAPPTKLTEYLPAAFGPSDLGVNAGLLSTQQHPLIFADSTSAQIVGAEAALANARASYAPYTRAYGGASITTRNRQIYNGMYLENAAFNPSVSPMQSAIVSAVLSGCSPNDFVDVCVAQCANSTVDHAQAADSVLASLAPRIQLQKILLHTE